MILSLVTTKGGTGKSTISECLAYSNSFKRAFDSIAIVELDRQGSIDAWYRTRDEDLKEKDRVKYFNLSGASRQEITKELDRIVNTFSCVVLDVPGESREGFSTLLALNLSDIVLIPMRASDKDEAAFFENLYPVISTVQKKVDDVDFFVVPNFLSPSLKAETVNDYFEDIMPEGVSYLGTFITNRVVIEGYGLDGLTLREYALSVKSNERKHKGAMKAVDEMEAVAELILKNDSGGK